MKTPFESVVAEHAGTVLRVCRAILGVDDGDDGWSETFLAAMRGYPDLPEDANVRAWLVTIAHRRSIDIIRARGRRALPVDQVPDTPSTIGVPEESGSGVWDAVGMLPDRQRRAVAYHYLGGLPYREVAALIGGSAAAARKAGSDGVKALRTALTGTDTHTMTDAARRRE